METNAPIQRANADATERATILAPPHLEQLHPECLILMCVHNETVVTAPKAVAEKAARILEEAMIEGARAYLARVPVEVVVSIERPWTK